MVGQPFDIIKVRLQTETPNEPLYKGAFDCLWKLLKNEGIFALYKGNKAYIYLYITYIMRYIGTLAPLIGAGLCLSLQFGVDGTMKKFFKVFIYVSTYIYCNIV